jgi:hypothetical protein
MFMFSTTLGTRIALGETAGLISAFFLQMVHSEYALYVGLATLVVTRIFDIIDRRQVGIELRKKMESDALLIKTQNATVRAAVEMNTEITTSSAKNVQQIVNKLEE